MYFALGLQKNNKNIIPIKFLLKDGIYHRIRGLQNVRTPRWPDGAQKDTNRRAINQTAHYKHKYRAEKILRNINIYL